MIVHDLPTVRPGPCSDTGAIGIALIVGPIRRQKRREWLDRWAPIFWMAVMGGVVWLAW